MVRIRRRRDEKLDLLAKKKVMSFFYFYYYYYKVFLTRSSKLIDTIITFSTELTIDNA